MQIKIPQPSYLRHFAVVGILIFATVIGLFSWFTWRIYNAEEEKIITKLELESEKIDRVFTDTIDHTSFIMKMMNMQIKPNYDDPQYINEILSKYRTNPNISNILSWTIFSWANASHKITVDAVYGVLNDTYDLSDRDYIPLTMKDPGTMQLGKPVFGSTSQRWMIPGGVGAVDSAGKYIGAITIGFDIDSMVASLRNTIKTDGIEFAFIDDSAHVVMRSSDKLTELGPKGSDIPDSPLKNLLQQSANGPAGAIYTKAEIFQNGSNYYFYKLKNYPYLIYTRYDKSLIQHELWRALTSRFIEISVIGLVALILSLFIYRRETNLRKLAEAAHQEALMASKAKSEFLAYTNHELRSPLNMIILGAEMIQNKLFGKLPQKYVDYATDIHQNGKDLLEFIEDLLDEAQATSGNFSLQEEETNVGDVVRRAINLNTSRAHKHKIMLETHIDGNLPHLWADPRRLRQILNNLLSNSIKYSPEHTTVTVRAKHLDDGVHLIVSDQGFGMTDEDLQIALTEYGTVKNKHTGRVESLGLGLPLVKQLADAHGALFTIESEPEKGTSVIIIFPAEKVYRSKDGMRA